MVVIEEWGGEDFLSFVGRGVHLICSGGGGGCRWRRLMLLYWSVAAAELIDFGCRAGGRWATRKAARHPSCRHWSPTPGGETRTRRRRRRRRGPEEGRTGCAASDNASSLHHRRRRAGTSRWGADNQAGGLFREQPVWVRPRAGQAQDMSLVVLVFRRR